MSSATPPAFPLPHLKMGDPISKVTGLLSQYAEIAADGDSFHIHPQLVGWVSSGHKKAHHISPTTTTEWTSASTAVVDFRRKKDVKRYIFLLHVETSNVIQAQRGQVHTHHALLSVDREAALIRFWDPVSARHKRAKGQYVSALPRLVRAMRGKLPKSYKFQVGNGKQSEEAQDCANQCFIAIGTGVMFADQSDWRPFR